MSDLYFSKANLGWREVIIIFKQGELGNPVCILQKNDIEKLVNEWKKKVEE